MCTSNSPGFLELSKYTIIVITGVKLTLKIGRWIQTSACIKNDMIKRNDILSHKFFYVPHGFPFFRPPVSSRRLTEWAYILHYLGRT